MQGNCEDRREGSFVKNEGKVVSEKLPRNLENMKEKKISDLFGFLRWLDGLDGILIFYKKRKRKNVQFFVFESNLFTQVLKALCKNPLVLSIINPFSKWEVQAPLIFLGE